MGIHQPVIGLPVNLLVDKNAGMERVFVNLDYVRGVKLAGGLPIALPFVTEREDVLAQLDLLDGLLFPGGADLSPLTFGEEPERGLEDVYPDMDAHQLALARTAWERRLPMLGICRGMQVLNVAFGGTLHQDLISPTLQHVQKSQRHAIGHSVDLAEGSRLNRIFGQPAIGTNSFHHQAVKDVAPGFGVSARARDGVVEGFERTDEAFVLGVQWHPESMVERHPAMLGVFKALIDACQAQHA